ncbi:spore gernimation protein GerPD [Halobacillus massiliensis]|uniref:spore gernimation protein GerPD n=1 Tax=Halobacillus massiliensis TaxID=1926286 RepID=UPI0009E648B1|nr:spore gernimation protein GerPD [Halobacillus massiliensis]
MNFTVHNYGFHIGHVQVRSVTTSSVFLIGDNETVRLRSFFDTPPESLIIGPFVPTDVDAELERSDAK